MTDYWRTEPFVMFENGPLWIPPSIPFYDSPSELSLIENETMDSLSDISVGSEDEESISKEQKTTNSKQLSLLKRRQFEKMLRHLTLARGDIGRAMLFCINHAYAAEEIVDILSQSLLLDSTPIYPLKIARFYVLTDVLHNSSTTKPNVWKYRSAFEAKLPLICHHLGQISKNIPGRLRQEQYKSFIIAVLDAWEQWIIFPFDFLSSLKKSYQRGVSGTERFTDNLNEQKELKLGFYAPSFIALQLSEQQKVLEKEQEKAYLASFKKTTTQWVSLDDSSLSINNTKPSLIPVPLNISQEIIKEKNKQESDSEGKDGISQISFNSDEDLDGVPLDFSLKQNFENKVEKDKDIDEDIDGIPLNKTVYS